MVYRLLTTDDLIKNIVSGQSIYLPDSAELPLEGLSIDKEGASVYICGNNLFNPTNISASSKTITTKSNYGNIDSTEYNGEIKLISPKFKYNPDSTGADNYLTTYINGTFYVWINDAFMKRSLDGTIYTFIADVVLDERHNNEVSGEPAPDTMAFTGTGGGLSSANVIWTGVNSEGKSVGKVACAFKNKHAKNTDGTINYEAQNKIEVRTVGKSMTFTNIMLLPGDWSANPPKYEDYKEQLITNIEDYRNFHTYYPKTRIISGTDDAIISVKYIADTKNYVNNKSTEAAALILEVNE